MDSRRPVAGGVIVFLLSGCTSRRTISHHQNVYPILEANCLACHKPPDGDGYLKNQCTQEQRA